MNYGFVIHTGRCIGCHACSTACKSENQVPLGVHRTWVKYTEAGRFPDVRRTFQVTRCNHCANPPCVRICPVTAMYQRTDGIVEFDSDVCIGCKACLQACPYDAIYVDPDSGTAAKCHFCGHRVDNGLEPACVVVCPTHAILAGDLDDPTSEIAQAIAHNDVTVRRPEQGTAPKLFYIEGSAFSLHPTAAAETGKTMMASEGPGTDVRHEVHLRFDGEGRASSGTAIRPPAEQGVPSGGPIVVAGGRHAGQMVQVAYKVHAEVPWHWPVPAYLVTKGLGSGAFLLLATGALLEGLSHGSAALLAGYGVAAILVTTALLVGDLERPARFLRIVLRPQWKSWLARGAFLLIGFSLVASVWFALELGSAIGLIASASTMEWRIPLALAAVPLAIGTAIYTAFLFAQCEGRDLWQSPLLPIRLLVEAVLLGAAAGNMVGLWADLGPLQPWLGSGLLGMVVVDLALLLAGELATSHASEVAARASRDIVRGAYRHHFWVGAVLIGHLLPLPLLASGVPVLGAFAALLVIAGVYAGQHAFVMAPQRIPNS
jgi:Fe-S-cluster-containing dehydrogenase component/formate-dependent nitrite reductase membrane component NrfD